MTAEIVPLTRNRSSKPGKNLLAEEPLYDLDAEKWAPIDWSGVPYLDTPEGRARFKIPISVRPCAAALRLWDRWLWQKHQYDLWQYDAELRVLGKEAHHD